MTLTYSKDRQLTEYRRHARKALRQMRRWMKDNEDVIIADGEERAFSIGFEQYGDKTWHLSFEQLVKEQRAEIADGVYYGVVLIARGWK